MLIQKLPEFLTELEKAVLAYLLQGDSEETQILLEQLTSSALKSRKYTGCGFFTDFDIHDKARRCERKDFELGQVIISLSGQDCGFLLFVREGQIAFLEGYTFGVNEWPLSETIEKVSGFSSC